MGVVLLVLSLTWHLVGMDHGTDMGVLGACVTILAAALAVLITGEAGEATWIVRTTRALPAPAVPVAPMGGSRPPPREGTVLRR